MICPDLNLVIDPSLAPPTEAQARHLCQIVLACLGDRVARYAAASISLGGGANYFSSRKISTDNMSAEDKRKQRFSYQVGNRALLESRLNLSSTCSVCHVKVQCISPPTPLSPPALRTTSSTKTSSTLATGST